MPWEFQIHVPADATLEDLKQALCDTLPGIECGWEPTGPERLAATRARGHEPPPIIVEHMLEADIRRYSACYEAQAGGGSIAIFDLHATDGILYAEARGRDPARILQQLCDATGWWISDHTSKGAPIDLSRKPRGWSEYQGLVNVALAQARGETTKE